MRRHHQAHLCSKPGMNLEACGSGACPKHPEFVDARCASLKVRASARPDGRVDIPPPAAPKPCPQRRMWSHEQPRRAAGWGALDTCRLSSKLLSPADRGLGRRLIWSESEGRSLLQAQSPVQHLGGLLSSQKLPGPHRGPRCQRTPWVLNSGQRCTQPAFPTPPHPPSAWRTETAHPQGNRLPKA